jgi:hypothetical protein
MNCRMFHLWLETRPVAALLDAERHAASCARCSTALRAADEVEAFLAELGGEPEAGFTDRGLVRLPDATGAFPVPLDATVEPRASWAARQPENSVRGAQTPLPSLARAALALVGLGLLGLAVTILTVGALANATLLARGAAGAIGEAAAALAHMGLTAGGRILAESSARAGMVLMLLPSVVFASRALSRWISARIAGQPVGS